MANDFKFRVVAQDQYTRIFQDLELKSRRLFEPLGKSAAKVIKVARFDQVALGITKLGGGASSLGRQLGLSIEPLESLFGIGRSGGIAAGIAVAGAATLGL